MSTVARFIEVWFGVENQCLNRNEDLEHGGVSQVPPLTTTDRPGVEQAQTHLTTFI
jgi:hypothetical protein